MFTFKKKTHARIIDTPNKMYIEPTFIAVPLPDGRTLVLHGNFQSIRDAEANLLVQNTLDKIAA